MQSTARVRGQQIRRNRRQMCRLLSLEFGRFSRRGVRDACQVGLVLRNNNSHQRKRNDQTGKRRKVKLPGAQRHKRTVLPAIRKRSLARAAGHIFILRRHIGRCRAGHGCAHRHRLMARHSRGRPRQWGEHKTHNREQREQVTYGRFKIHHRQYSTRELFWHAPRPTPYVIIPSAQHLLPFSATATSLRRELRACRRVALR